MLYHLARYATAYWSIFNMVHYVSFRVLAAFLTTLGLSFLAGDKFIRFAERHFRVKARKWTPESHKKKDNLPTMGGIFMIGLITINTLLWCDLTSIRVWLLLGTLLGFGAIGAWDDWCKIKSGNGVSARVKFGLQCAVGFTMVALLLLYTSMAPTITIPFFKNLQPNIGWLFIPWALFIIIGTSNGVNLTDGLDGLAIGCLIPNFATFLVLCYVAGNMVIANYLHIPFAGTAEIVVMGATFLGATLGFLWYNAYPAHIFMGDVGSLSLGAALAFMALLCKQEILLALTGGVFVAETISVILQVLSYKLRGKKIFRMAPMHHHFELLGWQEAKITVRFAIISLILCISALLTIKIR